MMTDREIYATNFNEDGSLTVYFVGNSVERYSDKADIAAISSIVRKQKEQRERHEPKYPSLLS